VSLVLDSVGIIKYFRKSDDIRTAVTVFSWGIVQNKFKETLKNIGNKVDHLQKLVRAQNLTQLSQTQANLAERLSQLTFNIAKSSSMEEVILPCETLPFQRNPNFVGRRHLNERISKVLTHHGRDKSIRSIGI